MVIRKKRRVSAQQIIEREAKRKLCQKKAFARWHAKNREKFAAQRNERYKNDPEYRETVKSRVIANQRKCREKALAHSRF